MSETYYPSCEDDQCGNCGHFGDEHLCPPSIWLEMPHEWTGLMAGFAPADMDFSTTNSGDVGGPVSEKP
jgi:hypothetical protein